MKRNKIAMLLAMGTYCYTECSRTGSSRGTDSRCRSGSGNGLRMWLTRSCSRADEDASEEAEAEIEDDAEESQEDFAAEEDLSDGTAQETFSDDAGEAGEKRYEFGRNYDDSSSNTGYMLPNSTMNISTWLDCVDGDDWNEISEYSLKLLPMEEGYA